MLNKIVLDTISKELSRVIVVDEVTFNSNTVRAGSLFFALKGAKDDGRKYIQDVLNQNAYVICDKRDLAHILLPEHPNLITVNDAHDTIITIARNIRLKLQESGVKIIGVVGTSGKTFTKNAIGKILNDNLGSTLVSHGNLNTEYGLLLTLARADQSIKHIVLELGISKPNDMDILGHIAGPDMVIVLNIGMAHVGNFNSENIINGRKLLVKEKLKILQYLQRNGVAVIKDDLKDYIDKDLRIDITYFHNKNSYYISNETINTSGNLVINDATYTMNCPNLFGDHILENTLGIIELLNNMVNPAKAIESIESMTQLEGRGILHRNIMYRDKRFDIYDSSYNANLGENGSLYREFEVLKKLDRNRSVLLVLGEIVELGSNSGYLHEKLLDDITNMGYQVILVGSIWSQLQHNYSVIPHYITTDTVDHAINMIYTNSVDGGFIFVKGSNANGLQKIVARLLEVVHV